MRVSLTATALSLLPLLVSGSALAQVTGWQEPAPESPPAAPPVAASPAPDIVELKDGSVFRGTIAEKVVGEAVTIVLATGKTRVIEWEKIAYAGPAGGAPSEIAAARAAQPAPAKPPLHATPPPAERPEEPRNKITVHGEAAHIRFESKGEKPLTLYAQSGTAVGALAGRNGAAVAIVEGYTRVCTAPCEATLPAGTETLALSDGGPRELARVEEPVRLPPGYSRLDGTLTSRRGTRIAGGVILAGGSVAGLAISLVPMLSRGKDRLTVSNFVIPMAVGAAVSLGSAIAGALMLRVQDEATVTVTPLGPAPAAPDSPASVLSLGDTRPAETDLFGRVASPGLTVTGTF